MAPMSRPRAAFSSKPAFAGKIGAKKNGPGVSQARFL
jgi:hypothetical protein